MYSYHPVEETICHAEHGKFTTYGILVVCDGQILYTLSDVFADRVVVESICHMCTQEQVEPVHLNDVIYDML